ncbi:hypothetical protein D9619_001143 [Psilocybe cf. subviscida]|uniref:Uncharacterized protein n=1 Tax=Psilocybe cf. subviscida TaxID=2480587 RepID=A0A8H5F3L5_9AGAR|nr:hypothetical protein D9619_001143 [Psilocybe cf. subviscida]
MATPAAFSRLQLAAALLEYDNDPENPDAPYKSAQESAIFAHLRRNPAARPEIASRKSDYLSVALPSEGGGSMGIGGGRESALDTRRSRASKGSIDALHNPFGADVNSTENSDAGDDEEKERNGEEEGLEVDLASWGLDAFIPKDKKSAKGKGKQPAVPASVNASRSRLLSNSNVPPDPSALTPARRGLVTSKSVSLGGDIEANLAINRAEIDRRRSFGSPLDLVGMEPSGEPIHPPGRPRAQSHAAPTLVPFPTAPSVRSPSPGPDQAYASDSMSRRPGNMRTYSMASMNSRMLLPEDEREDAASQLYPDNASRYDPAPAEDNPFAIQHTTHTSRFDPKSMARARSHSNATLGSRFPPDAGLAPDNVSTFTGRTGRTGGDPYARERRYSTLELLRPKVLVMPSPLQQAAPPPPPEPKIVMREGFEISTDGPPLPPGARTSRRLSSTMSLLDAANADPGLVASNSFTPNPLLNLTLSQKTFRNTLAVPGQSSLPYMDGTSALPRATEEGEQVQLDGGDGARPESVVLPENGLPGLVDPNSKASRPAGKLYGKSLIDDLEQRKATMRSKQRVFTGDQRPSMMARESSRSSTLIDPATLVSKPEAVGAGLSRHPSVTLKPLITFDSQDNVQKSLAPPAMAGRLLPSTRSVFGVDTLWQREMEKLKEIEKQEAVEREEERLRDEKEEEEKRRKREKKEKKGKNKKRNARDPPAEVQAVEDHQQRRSLHAQHALDPSSSTADVDGYDDGLAIPRVSAEPPTLPDIRRASRKPPPKPSDSDVSSDSDDEEEIRAQTRPTDAGWNSSDEEEAGPRRTTGVGPRYRTRSGTGPTHVPMPLPTEDSGEEDLPLAAAMEKVRQRHTGYLGRGAGDDSEDEDKPLSRIIQEKSRGGAPSVHNLRPPNAHARPGANDDEDDNEPLALRASRIPPALAGDDEDEMPLAFHPEQQRRTQYQMLQQHQQQQQMAMAQAQQQQMMMQAQMQSNMLMNPGMMSPGYFNPTMMNPMAMMPMQPPMPMPSPPPMHDAAKHSLVDRWRREVEG